MKLEGFFASSRAVPADPVARGEDWGPLAGRFQAGWRIFLRRALARTRRKQLPVLDQTKCRHGGLPG